MEIAREIVEGCDTVIANVERLAAELPDETPILAAAELGEFDEIDRAWVERIKRIGIQSA